MIVPCEKCQTKFRIADERVSEAGVKVRCSRCAHVFVARRPPAGAGEQGAASELDAFGLPRGPDTARIDPSSIASLAAGTLPTAPEPPPQAGPAFGRVSAPGPTGLPSFPPPNSPSIDSREAARALGFEGPPPPPDRREAPRPGLREHLSWDSGEVDALGDLGDGLRVVRPEDLRASAGFGFPPSEAPTVAESAFVGSEAPTVATKLPSGRPLPAAGEGSGGLDLNALTSPQWTAAPPSAPPEESARSSSLDLDLASFLGSGTSIPLLDGPPQPRGLSGLLGAPPSKAAAPPFAPPDPFGGPPGSQGPLGGRDPFGGPPGSQGPLGGRDPFGGPPLGGQGSQGPLGGRDPFGGPLGGRDPFDLPLGGQPPLGKPAPAGRGSFGGPPLGGPPPLAARETFAPEAPRPSAQPPKGPPPVPAFGTDPFARSPQPPPAGGAPPSRPPGRASEPFARALPGPFAGMEGLGEPRRSGQGAPALTDPFARLPGALPSSGPAAPSRRPDSAAPSRAPRPLSAESAALAEALDEDSVRFPAPVSETDLPVGTELDLPGIDDQAEVPGLIGNTFFPRSPAPSGPPRPAADLGDIPGLLDDAASGDPFAGLDLDAEPRRERPPSSAFELGAAEFDPEPSGIQDQAANAAALARIALGRAALPHFADAPAGGEATAVAAVYEPSKSRSRIPNLLEERPIGWWPTAAGLALGVALALLLLAPLRQAATAVLRGESPRAFLEPPPRRLLPEALPAAVARRIWVSEYPGEGGARLLVVGGEAHNIGEGALEGVTAVVLVLDGDAVVERRSAPVGVELSEVALAEIGSPAALDRALARAGTGPGLSRMTAGAKAPFMVVFPSLPERARERTYHVELVGSEASARAETAHQP